MSTTPGVADDPGGADPGVGPRPARALAELVALAPRIQGHLDRLIQDHVEQWRAAGGDDGAEEVLTAYRDLALSGGKRLRPAFTYWAHEGAGGDPADPRVLDAALAVELLHTFALIHDDVMDRAATRRSVPTIHVAHADRHRRLGLRGDATHHGHSVAILVGDLAFAHAAQLVTHLPPDCTRIFFAMCADLVVGQYLDIESAAHGIGTGTPVAARVTELKTARYTVVSPLLMGAALAGREAELAAPLRAYGTPVGHAFQLRDDLLGAFGDPSVTGKPVGDDLAQGKVTRLVELGVERAQGPDREAILRLGRPEAGPDDVDRARRALESCGARAAVEARIEALVAEAVAALDGAPLTPRARALLADAAVLVAHRDR